ncbi:MULTISPECIES: NADP-dependent isocitrate dehydrogenase [Flavobacteriaceae]|uniref:NADP-dependent isocitrate dehydrogenase n=1 Tax=Flavobacteriaceae TaxID=49546 RepID=UPI001C0EEEE0|nr:MULTISPECIES: NADP-dependent isocitrate dehydrogenase [Allomuricauda]MDC6367456.1 NADP-dependent isocitrate dehydrogenase [Muricauda sp. AC10]
MRTRTLTKEDSGQAINRIVKVAVAMGDGIGPEIMKATLDILKASGANIEPEFIDLGKEVYLSGESSGIAEKAWDTIANNKLIFKAPITTPQGKGFKSLNVTLRKSLGLFANVRPVSALHPYVATNFPDMDVVIIRENEEDLYAGIEHRQTQDVVQCLKLITRPGCERIIRYAFEYAVAFGRKKVTCMVKDNIMKLTDGLFHQVFKEIAVAYPQIQHDTQIIDIGSARLAAKPENYDVIVTPNLYGDIISDIAAEIGGSVGMAGSANIGKNVAMFEAIHGSAPDIAGQGIANPSGLINAAVMMLAHIGQHEKADLIKNAWLVTLEEGYHTADIYSEGLSIEKVNTKEFAQKVIENLGKTPNNLGASQLGKSKGVVSIPEYSRKEEKKELVGVDVFLDWPGNDAHELGAILAALDVFKLKLKMITNRGVKVYPKGLKETFCTDHWRCRFVGVDANIDQKEPEYSTVGFEQVVALLSRLNHDGFDVIKTENLYKFNGKRGFSLGQGE